MADSRSLALEPFEKYMLWDDSPVAPMTPVVELDFDSGLDPPTLVEAFDEALLSHPLLRSRVLEQRDGGLVWDLVAADAIPRVAIVSEAETEMRPIDLTRGAGLRACLFPRETGFRLRIQWHHASCDGVGMRSLLVTLLAAYHRRKGGQFPQRRRVLDPELLVDRGDFSNVIRQESIGTFQRLRNAHYFHFQLPQPLRSSQLQQAGQGRGPHPKPTSAPPLGFPVQVDIDRAASRKIIHRCKNQQLSIGTLATGLLFRQSRDWNRLRGGVKPNGRMRMLLPYDLRNSRQLRMPAANRMSFAFVGRKYQDTDDLAGLMVGLQAEMDKAKRTQLPLDFLAGLKAASRSRRAMRWVLSGHACMATAVVTYAGDIARGLGRSFEATDDGVTIGDCRLLRIGAAPPARLHTNIAIGLCHNWGQLCFSASYCAAQFSRGECEQFLNEYVALWLTWLEKK